MIQFTRKIFSLKDIKYSWLLLLSAVIFGVSTYIDRMDANDPSWLYIIYWFSFAIAVFWGAINYIGHIRMNTMYKKQNDIQVYIGQLAMSVEDKMELKTYLEDYVQDLIEQGQPEKDATREAINQFKVKEFLSLSKNTMIFNLHAHYYLFGWTIVTIFAFILAWLFGEVFPLYPLITFTIEIIFVAYGIGIFGMFFLYKLLDAIIYRKFRKLFS